jgi:hypothetical protein
MSDPKDDLPIRLPDQIFLGKKYFCNWCDAEIEGFRDNLSAKEFKTTGMCQNCRDTILKRKNV